MSGGVGEGNPLVIDVLEACKSIVQRGGSEMGRLAKCTSNAHQ